MRCQGQCADGCSDSLFEKLASLFLQERALVFFDILLTLVADGKGEEKVFISTIP